MSNKVLQSLTIERIERLRLAFSSSKNVFWDTETGRLSHPGEYGTFREKAVQELLKLFTPEQFGIDNGFVITNLGDVSSQCDVIIFDRSKTPSIVTESHQRFFPVESVVAVGEVKSNVGSGSSLIGFLSKLAKIKALRERITNPSPYRSHENRSYEPHRHPFDQMFTFLICNKFAFDPKSIKLEYDKQTPVRFRHNLVLSITDGLYCYGTIGGPPNIPYPNTADTEHLIQWISAGNDELPSHIGIFLSYLYNALNVVTLLEPDMALYLSDNVFNP